MDLSGKQTRGAARELFGYRYGYLWRALQAGVISLEEFSGLVPESSRRSSSTEERQLSETASLLAELEAVDAGMDAGGDL